MNHHPQRCHRGRKGKMDPSSKQEAEEEGEVVMNSPHMEDEEVMNKEEGEVDVVATTMVAEGEEEEISIKEAGQMEGVEEEEVATKMVVIEIRASSQVAIMVATVVATKVVVMVATKHLHTQEVDTRVVATSRTIDTKRAVRQPRSGGRSREGRELTSPCDRRWHCVRRDRPALRQLAPRRPPRQLRLVDKASLREGDAGLCTAWSRIQAALAAWTRALALTALSPRLHP